MSGFAGALRERVTLLRRSEARDAIGAAVGGWTDIGTGWAAIVPAGTGPAEAGGARAALPLWRITLRDRDLAVGDRVAWDGRTIEMRAVSRDPALPGRVTAIGEEQR